MACPNPSSRRSTSRRPLKNSSPARTRSSSNSARTKSSGDAADTARSRRPATVRSSNARRRAGSIGGDCASGTRRSSTIGRNSSAHRRSVTASVREKRVRAALQRVGLTAKHGVCPPQLSSGEKQRANLARAIVHHPKLIVADEPTGNLDPDLSVDMMRLLSTFQEAGVGLIIATHDVYLMDQFPHYRLHLHNGMVDYDASDWEPVS